ncbi:MAG: RluA family pseudouridine synthase, partial [Candidatus Eremiobacteraeota bacterium]|nr:RluA family pseudouridine synthase [Candidatus Eremiobacteraeota bacterium]
MSYFFQKGRNPERLDLFLSRESGLTRAKIKNLLSDNKIFINGGTAEKAGILLKGGEKLEISLPEPESSELKPEAIPLEILYEDKDLLVINKPAGLVVHPAAGHWEGTLVNALLYHFNQLSSIYPLRPGIVHRLDKDTSGVLLIAKSDKAHLQLSKQLKSREIKKDYAVIVHGRISQNEGIIDQPIGRHPKDRKKMAVVSSNGRDAVTRFKVLERFKNHTFLECRIETGRTHQIRVHLSNMGYPIIGDSLYGRKKDNLAARQ